MATESNEDGRMRLRDLPCLVCHKPCRSEGQLCDECVEAGHYVTDTEVVVNIEIDVPESLRPRSKGATDE